jgi:hypothetical protein
VPRWIAQRIRICAEELAELDGLDRTGGTAEARESKWWSD